jgi:acyl-coenzyme A synthetase/AMP-(fatty) acid ligase/acyl carrier protein
VLAATSICFDLSVYELFVPLAHGGKVILARDALELPTLAAEGEVRLVNTVPSVMRELVSATGLPESVRVVNLAGEPLKRALADEIHERLPGLSALYNLYGPSEDTTYSTVATVPPGDGQPGDEPTIGRPIAGTRACVLDPLGQPSPVGVPGELHLAGAGLARGYLGRPSRTAESFVPDPFGAGLGAPGGRLYRTGDLVRWRRDGELEFLGRLDHQVKVRGFRIELGEIEATLASHPAIAEAVVTVHQSADGEGDDLVAYLVPERRVPGDEDEAAPSDAQADSLTGQARDWLQERLPGYMIPALFTELEELPRTPSGKIDRKALPAPDAGRPDLERSFEPPETELEIILAEFWGEVLGVERIGIHDDFFELGGHSLKATQVLLRVRDEFGVDLPVRRFFEDPTVAGLSVALGEALLADVDEADLAGLLDDED